MADKVGVNYEILGQAAQQFGQLSADVTQLNQQLATPLAALRQGGWQGAAATAFVATMDEEIEPACHRLALALAATESWLHQIATIFSHVEEDARTGFGRVGS